MQVRALTAGQGGETGRVVRAASREGEFAARLSVALSRRTAERSGQVELEHQARQAAQQLVATTLVQPLLSQVRKDPLRSELMHGGLTEDAFGAQLDTELADRIVRRSNWPLVERIVDAVVRTAKGGLGIKGGAK